MSTCTNYTHEELDYLRYKSSYYRGTPEISDQAFDYLENKLEKLNSPVTKIVGFKEQRGILYNHPSLMGSLSKYQALIDGTPPTQEVIKWMNQLIQKVGQKDIFESSPKFDGNSCNLIYKNRKLQSALTRGEGDSGYDISNTVGDRVPQYLNFDHEGIIEVRGEIVMPMTIFESKYNSVDEIKNARNVVAGLLNRDDISEEDKQDLDFVAFDIRETTNDKLSYLNDDLLLENGFNIKEKLFTLNINPENFEEVYYKMLDYRLNSSPYQLDGFVIKLKPEYRGLFKANEKKPSWGKAIKFPASDAISSIIDVEWTISVTGEMCPTAILDPIELDGTEVSRASLHNYGYIIKNETFIGSVVKIAKKGDIIPQVIGVEVVGDKFSKWHPTSCMFCGSELTIDGVHLQCDNKECDGKLYSIFESCFEKMKKGLKLKDIGPAMMKQLWDNGFKYPVEIFDKIRFTEENLISTGLKQGVVLSKMVAQITKIKELPLSTVLMIMGYKNLGESISKELSKFISGIDYDFKSMEKEVVSGWEIGEDKRKELDKIIEFLKDNGVSVKFEENTAVKEGLIKFEMTGSPKEFGFKTKEDFVSYVAEKGYIYSSSGYSVLFCEDENGNSSKIVKARKNGITIIGYDEI